MARPPPRAARRCAHVVTGLHPEPWTLHRPEPCPLPPPQLAEVLVLEGLGPAPELESLPYGYQRRTAAGSTSSSAAAAAGYGPSLAGGPAPAPAAAAAAAGGGPVGGGGVQLHERFVEAAKAEHVAEHDLFRQLLLSKQQVRGGGGGGGGGPGAGAPAAPSAGMFEAVPDDEEADEP